MALLVMVMPATPRAVSWSATFWEGWGVILSIMDQGKLTLSSQESQRRKSSGTKPPFCQPSARVRQLSRSFLPFWAQLSMLTTAMGLPPARNR